MLTRLRTALATRTCLRAGDPAWLLVVGGQEDSRYRYGSRSQLDRATQRLQELRSQGRAPELRVMCARDRHLLDAGEISLADIPVPAVAWNPDQQWRIREMTRLYLRAFARGDADVNGDAPIVEFDPQDVLPPDDDEGREDA